MPKYHFYKQHDHSDCGATCLRIIFRYPSLSTGILKEISVAAPNGKVKEQGTHDELMAKGGFYSCLDR